MQELMKIMLGAFIDDGDRPVNDGEGKGADGKTDTGIKNGFFGFFELGSIAV